MADSLAKSLLRKDSKQFWREVRKASGKKHGALATTVNGATGEAGIADMWKHHYSHLLNSSTDVSKRSDVLERLSGTSLTKSDLFARGDIQQAIERLPAGKATGCDGLSSEHFKFASSTISYLLCFIFVNARIFSKGYFLFPLR